MYDVAFIGNGIEAKCNGTVVDPEKLVRVSGQIGCFELSAEESGVIGAICAKTIVVNMEPEETLPVDGAESFGADAGEPEGTAVFIQDYLSLTPAYYNKTGLLNAIRIKERFGKEVVYFYRSMRFPDGDGSLYKSAKRLGIVFEKYAGEDLQITRRNGFQIDFGNAFFTFSIHTRSLYLAPLIKPGRSYERIAGILHIRESEEGFLQTDNVYLQPTRTNRRGIYTIGFAKGRSGMSSLDGDIAFTLSDIKRETNLLRPLTADRREVDEQLCALCYTCFRSCPHGAVEREESRDCMKINEYACYGCNTCISACPAQAISIAGEKDGREKDIGKSPEGKPYKILLCENSAETAYRELGEMLGESAEIGTIPCSNSVRKSDIYRALSGRGGKLLVLGCINDACRHIDGNRNFERVVREARKNLSGIGLDPDRVRFERVSLRMKDRLKEIIDQFMGVEKDDCSPSKTN